MRFRTIALVLALAFASSAALEAKVKPRKVKVQGHKAPKHKARKIKNHKVS